MTQEQPPAEFTVHLKSPHAGSRAFYDSSAKRRVGRAGRRGGKTTTVSSLSVKMLLNRRRVLYAAPTQEQIQSYWFEVTHALAELIQANVLRKNETEHFIEFPNTKARIRAKTAWNADTLRGDYADFLVFDEYQLMNEDAWQKVGAPMLLDNDGDAVFIFTPPSIRSRSVSKATDPMHANKLFKRALLDKTGRWAAFTWTSHDNPVISRSALAEITSDMSSLAYRQEIMAEDIDILPGALWSYETFEKTRVDKAPQLVRVAVAIDPSASATELSDAAGIVAGGLGEDGHGYVLADKTGIKTPREWASTAVNLLDDLNGDRIIAEVNNGGDMVEETIRTVSANAPYRAVHASRGKLTRAEPISALYEKGLIHHAGRFPELEDECASYVPGARSPNRMDALVWLMTDLMLTSRSLGLVDYLSSGIAQRDADQTERMMSERAVEFPAAAPVGACPECEAAPGLVRTVPGGQARCSQCGVQWWPAGSHATLSQAINRTNIDQFQR